MIFDMGRSRAGFDLVFLWCLVPDRWAKCRHFKRIFFLMEPTNLDGFSILLQYTIISA
jgi:hypothetical protein